MLIKLLFKVFSELLLWMLGRPFNTLAFFSSFLLAPTFSLQPETLKLSSVSALYNMKMEAFFTLSEREFLQYRMG